MSIHHNHPADSDQTPIVLPLAVITVDTYGILTVTLDGAEYPPPSPTTPWSKARFADLLDTLTLDRTRTIRVEVHEADGSTFTDIIHAAPTARTHSRDERAEVPRRARHRHTPDMIEVTGAGFSPGKRSPSPWPTPPPPRPLRPGQPAPPWTWASYPPRAPTSS